MKTMNMIVSAIAIAAGAAAVALAADPPKAAPPAAAPAAAKAASTEAKDLKWAPMDPSNPKGPQISVVAGDPSKPGPSTLLFKAPPGFKAPQHMHTADYYAVVVSGTPAHGDDEKSAKPHTSGSTWFEPGKHGHFDTCTSKEECIMVLNIPNGPFDFVAVDAKGNPLPAPAAAKPK